MVELYHFGGSGVVEASVVLFLSSSLSNALNLLSLTVPLILNVVDVLLYL
jgi:hypothetical protein